MRPLHVTLAVFVAVIWGVAFVATQAGLQSLSPSQLTLLRFVIASIPAAGLARPCLPWSTLVPIGLTLFAGQFLFQFFGIAHGMPAGLASVIVQTQAFFTLVFAVVALGEQPTPRQLAGITIALGGLVLIAATVGADLTIVGFGLTLLAAISWGIGNILLKRLGEVDMRSLMVWLSLVPPLPSLALSMLLDGPAALLRLVVNPPWLGIAAALYLGLVATVVAYAIWARLLRQYPVATVAPFALLVPFVGAASTALVFGERFGPLRVAGMALVLVGLAVIVLPLERRRRSRERPPAAVT